MENSFLVSLSHLSSLKREMDVIANNLANVSTDSFKSESVLFEEYVSPVAEGEEKLPDVSFVLDYGMVRNLSVGNLIQTGSPLDVAIAGDGYYAVQLKDRIAYTRNGNFSLNDKGELVNPQGYQILNPDMKPIVIPAGAGMPNISADGTISGPGLPNLKLPVYTFANEQTLEKIGSNLFVTDQEKKLIENGKVNLVQGSVESSNVQPVNEITRMIEVMRKYQSAVQLTETEDELTRKAIDQLARVR